MKVGIDLGTTYSLVAGSNNNNTPFLFPDFKNINQFFTPSEVCLRDGIAYIGNHAHTQLIVHPDKNLKLIKYFKRELGSNNVIFTDSSSNQWFPQTIAALVLKKLKTDVSMKGEELESAVITVPAHFNDLQRNAVKEAAKLADINLVGLIDEPLAAALHYGVSQNDYTDKARTILVYDLGGGTFDVTIVNVFGSKFEVKAKDGLTKLGGREFNKAISLFIRNLFQKQHKYHLPETLAIDQKLELISENLKIELSHPTRYLIHNFGVELDGKNLLINITRKDFERDIASFIEKTNEITLRCINEANLQTQDIDVALLVGGSTLMPIVKKSVTEIFNIEKTKILFHEPVRAIAYGAAIYSSSLNQISDNFLNFPELRNVTGYNVGIEVKNNQNNTTRIEKIIRKNIPLPAKSTRTFFTTEQNLIIRVVQFFDENDLKNPVELGELIIGPLDESVRNKPFNVIITYTEEGTIEVTVINVGDNKPISKTFGNERRENINRFRQQKTLLENTILYRG